MTLAQWALVGWGAGNKVAVGKHAKHPPLPPADLGTPSHVWLSGNLGHARALIDGEPGDDADEEDISVLTDRFCARIGRVKVPSERHPEITRFVTNIERKLARYNDDFLGGYFQKGLRQKIDERRVRVMNALLMAAERFGQGGYLHLSDDPVRITLTFGGTGQECWVDMSDEGALAVETGRGRGDLSWRDEPGNRIEQQLTEIVVAIATAGVESRRRLDADVRAFRKWEAEKTEADRSR